MEKETKELEWLKHFWKRRKKMGRMSLPDFKSCYRALVVRMVWYQQKDRHRDQQNKERNKKSCHVNMAP